MSKSIISQGKTTNEAIEKGLKELNVSKSMVEIKVLEEEKRSFYNILAPRVVKVELTVKEVPKEEQEHKEKKWTAEIKEYDIYVNVDGENVNYLIGYRGENINSLQTILSSIANKKTTTKIRVYLDIAGYREKRIKTLEDLAEKLARTVERTKKPVTLEPMTAYERKIIHTKLQNNSKVKTFSKGEEPYRKVVISLK